MRSTVPRLVLDAAALAAGPTFFSFVQVFPLVVGLPGFSANFVPSSVRGCSFVASLRLRLASSRMRSCSVCQASDCSWQRFQMR